MKKEANSHIIHSRGKYCGIFSIFHSLLGHGKMKSLKPDRYLVTQIIIGKGRPFASAVMFLSLYKKASFNSTEYAIHLVHSVHMYSAHTFLELPLN